MHERKSVKPFFFLKINKIYNNMTKEKETTKEETQHNSDTKQ